MFPASAGGHISARTAAVSCGDRWRKTSGRKHVDVGNRTENFGLLARTSSAATRGASQRAFRADHDSALWQGLDDRDLHENRADLREAIGQVVRETIVENYGERVRHSPSCATQSCGLSGISDRNACCCRGKRGRPRLPARPAGARKSTARAPRVPQGYFDVPAPRWRTARQSFARVPVVTLAQTLFDGADGFLSATHRSTVKRVDAISQEWPTGVCRPSEHYSPSRVLSDGDRKATRPERTTLAFICYRKRGGNNSILSNMSPLPPQPPFRTSALQFLAYSCSLVMYGRCLPRAFARFEPTAVRLAGTRSHGEPRC